MNQYEVIVQLKKEVLDPEGRAIQETLVRLGHQAVKSVEVAKRFVLSVDPKSVTGDCDAFAKKLAVEFLSNPVSQTIQVKRL